MVEGWVILLSIIILVVVFLIILGIIRSSIIGNIALLFVEAVLEIVATNKSGSCTGDNRINRIGCRFFLMT